MAEFSQDLLAPGVAGIDLHHPNDLVPKTKLSRMRNAARLEEGAVSARPGTESLATGGVDRHTVMRLTGGGSFTRIWGVDDTIEVGQAGATTPVDFGYSGRPLCLLPYRPTLSGVAWAYVADDNRMRKVRGDGLNLPLGLVAPPAAAGSSLAAELRTGIETFDTTAGWVFNAGTGGALFPAVRIIPEAGKVGNCLTYSLMSGAAGPDASFYSFFIKNFGAINLNLVGGQPASDDDIIHLWARFRTPEIITEIKLYLICSASTDTETLPGTDETPGQNNSDAYVKSLRPSDFGPFILPDFGLSISPAIPSGQRRVSNQRTEKDLERQDDTRGGTTELRRQMREGARIRADQLITPKLAWTELGVVGVPLRRGDFLRIGTDENRSWGNVNGICLLIQATGTPEEDPPGSLYAACSLDDLYLVGGRGPDTIDPGQQQYDYRFRHIDLLTGDLSNPSPLQPENQFKDARRQGINVSGAAYADPDYPAGPAGANIRQEFYRRGGSLVENWYLAGRSASNGGGFLDTLTDSALQDAPTLELDNFQPVHTVDASGTEIDAVPLPSIWGPVQNLIMGCGDPNRPGHVYWCKPGNPGSWPSGSNSEVTAPSDPLMAGWSIAGRSLVFSVEGLHDLLIDLTGFGSVTPIPTQCSRGLVGRRGYIVHRGSCYFLAKDGVFRTAGGPEEDLTLDLWPLFHADAEVLANGKNGFFPIDRSFPDAVRMASFDDQVWVWFQDVRGQIVCWVFSTTYNYWVPYDFPQNITNGAQDDGTGERTMVLGSTEGESFDHAGPEDDGQQISCSFRTGCLDQGLPRDYKLYGDMVIDIDRGQQAVVVQAFLDNEVRQGTTSPQTVNYESPERQGGPLGGRQRFTLDLCGTNTQTPDRARNIAYDVSWQSGASGQPKIFVLGPSYIVQPDATIYRPTDWDFGGRLTDKWIKGVSLELDTFGLQKRINVEVDGVVVASFVAQTTGRQVQQFSFPQQMGRVMRLHPAVQTVGVPWFLYKFDWIFDEEPLKLNRWETQELDYGIPGWHYPLFAWLTLRATSQVIWTVTAYREAGSPIPAYNPFPYILAPTGQTKRKLYVPLDAMKGMLFKHVFESPGAFHLHREESVLIIQPWAADRAIEVRKWGNDDLDLTRGMQSARLTASKGGGG